jgi:4-hydroxy-3-polyprenylbenzoate decarboxylase
MAWKNLSEFIHILEQNGELIRIKEPVSTKLEITEIVDRVSKMPDGGKALLFENTGTDFPVLINHFGSIKRLCLLFGVEKLDDITARIETLFKTITGPKQGFLEKLSVLPKLGEIASWLPKVKSGRGACQEVVHHNPDLSILPVLTCWPHDGGPFVTLPMVNTRDPHTGIRNVGMYRMQIFDQNSTGMHWHRHKVGARHLAEYKKLGKKMPVSVAIGGDPACTFAAASPLPDNIDEYMLAGFLRQKKVELVKCITNDLEVPADADFVIEGYVDPEENLIWEGPFGDHTGFYSLADWYPKFHVSCITHRKNAVYTATIVGIPPQEDAWLAKAIERVFLAPMKLLMVPEMLDIDIPFAGVAHNLTIAKIKKTFPGQAQKVMNSLWGAGQMMFNKIMVVVDEDAEIHDYTELLQTISKNVEISRDIIFSSGPLDVLDHSASVMAYGSKMGIDATRKLPEELANSFPTKTAVNLSGFSKIKDVVPQIVDVSIKLAESGIPALLISFKAKEFKAKELINILNTSDLLQGIKCVIFYDENVDLKNELVTAWLVTGNIDPRRDCRITGEAGNEILWVDATSKVLSADFRRDWPNVIVMDDATIAKIDRLWPKLNLGEFVPSPSLAFKSMVYGNSAIAKL